MSRTPARRRPAAVVAALVVAAAVALAGCGSSASGGAARSRGPGASTLSGSITVFAAASLTGTFTELGRRFEAAHPGTEVRFSFGSSSTLAQQILAGAPADVFASASVASMTQVVEGGDIEGGDIEGGDTEGGETAGPRTFATNAAAIAVSPRSRVRVTGLADLAAPGVAVALCQVQAPCGALAASVLQGAGVAVTPVTQGLDVKATLAYVTSGEADAAVVYVTDVRAAGSAVVGVEIPAAQNATTAYPIATVRGSSRPDVASALEELVLSAEGREVLTGAGFGTP